MNTWSVTISYGAGVRVYSGQEPTAEAARAAGAGAAQTWARRAAPHVGHPRYTIDVDGRTSAVIVTGADDNGDPAHDEAADLLCHLYSAPTPSEPLICQAAPLSAFSLGR